MDTDVQEARRRAAADPTPENLAAVARLETRSGATPPFANWDEVIKARLQHQEELRKLQEKMDVAVNGLAQALGDKIELFSLQDAVAKMSDWINEGPAPRATLKLSPDHRLNVIATENRVVASLRIQGAGPNQNDVTTELGVSYYSHDSFPQNLPEKIAAAITLYG